MEWGLVGKSILLVLGGILAIAALVELSVGGWSVKAAIYLVVGLALVGYPLGTSFRDAIRRPVKGET